MKILNSWTPKNIKTGGEIKLTNRGNQSADVLIYGEIGGGMFEEGITARQFAEELRDFGTIKNLNVRINSTGGSVFDGVAIYNSLINHKARITVDIEGAALSIASIIAMAGDQVRIAENGFLMIHEPHGIFAGDSKDLRKAADTLEVVRGQLVKTYVNQRGINQEKIESWLSAETWFDSTEALAAGFVDEITGRVQMAASYDLSQFKNPPEILQNRQNVIKIEPEHGKTSACAALHRMKQGIKAQKFKQIASDLKK